jgi:hypothetical protein
LFVLKTPNRLWIITDEVQLAKYNKVLLEREISQKVFYSFHEMSIRIMFLLPTPLAYELKRYTAI